MTRKRKDKIWCEVACACCGSIASASGYYSPERIKKLKLETKDWGVNVGIYNIICPTCLKEETNTNEEVV